MIDPHANRADRHADVWALIDPLAPDLPGDSAAGQQEAWRRVVLYAMAAHLEPERAAMWARLWARAEALWIQALPDPADDDAWASRLHRFADALS